MDDEALTGGMANAGAVLRRGAVVERPAPPNARAIHAHLKALADHGFDAAPTPVRISPAGREELSFVPGDVALTPYPAWALTETALYSVGALLRRLHEASADIPLDLSAGWASDLADPQGGTLLCHNDVCVENVIFRDGRAVAVIDFDLAAPGRPVWDVAMAARYWVPMLDPESAAVSGRDQLHTMKRLRVLADGYGLAPQDRVDLPDVIEQATEVARSFVAARVAGGDTAFTLALAEHGGWERWDRIQAWMAAHRDAFASALLA